MMTQRFSIHSRDMETLCVKDGWKIFPVTLFISFKLDVYMYTTSSSLLQTVSWYKCFAYTTFSLTSSSYSILYFSGLVILHTVPWRKRRKAQKIYCGENLREESSFHRVKQNASVPYTQAGEKMPTLIHFTWF